MTTLSLAILGNLLRRSSLSLRKIKLIVSFVFPFSKFQNLFFVGQWRTYHVVHLLPRPDSSIPQILLQTSRHIIQECLISHPTLPLLPRLFNLHMLPRMDLLLHHPSSLLIALQLRRGFSRLLLKLSIRLLHSLRLLPMHSLTSTQRRPVRAVSHPQFLQRSPTHPPLCLSWQIYR